MAALIAGLLDLLRWLAQTAAAFFAWLSTTVTSLVHWLWSVVDWILVTAWNWFVEFLHWALSVLFALLGVLVTLPVKLLTLLVALLPPVPPELLDSLQVVIPAYSIADRILPLSDALLALSLWSTFYGLMALWRIITFVRGGR